MDYSVVADLYDAYCRFDADIPFFVDECRGTTGPVLELMCGTGRVSVPLLENGVDLTCVDASLDMLRLFSHKLTRHNQPAKLICADVSQLALPQVFELAFIPFHSFAELVDRPAQDATLANVYRALLPGGRFICTLHNPAIRLSSIGHGPTTFGPLALRDGSGEILVHTDLAYEQATGRVYGTQTVEQRDDSAKTVLRRRVAIEFVLIEPSDFDRQACDAGFKVVGRFGDYDRAPYSESSSPYLISVMER